MSNVSTLYDLFEARIQAVLPDHKRLSDPYRFLKNTDSEKRQGYGIKIVNGNNPNLEIGCGRILEQSLAVVLTRISQGRETDRAKKIEAEKQLLEDLFLIIKDIEKSPKLGNSTVMADSAYVSHDGVTFIGEDRDDYLLIEGTFRFRYNENIEN